MNLKICTFEIFSKPRLDDIVFNPVFWPVKNINIAENTRKPELVLVLEITAVAPL